MLSLVAFLSVYIIKNIYLIFFYWFEGKFIFSTREKVSSRLFKNYLYKDYIVHVNDNSGNLITRLKSDVLMFQGSLLNLTTLLSEIIVFTGLSIFLLLYESSGVFIISLAIIIFVTIFYLFSYKKIKKIGVDRQEIETYRSKKLQEGIGGIKEIKSFAMEDFFSNQYSNLSIKLSKAYYLFYVIQKIPKLYFETIAIAGIVMFCYYLISIDTELNTVVASLGIIVVASLRLIPSANRALNCYSGLKYSFPAINLIYQEVKNEKNLIFKNNDSQEIKFKKNIQLFNLSFKYQSRNNFILENTNLEIQKGEKIAILGNSGSGKSTLLDLIMGFHNPISGKILIDNNEAELNSPKWKKLVGYVSQSIYLFDDTILENIALGAKIKDLDKDYLEQCINICELNSLINNLPQKVDSAVGEGGAKISGGQKQRIGIARALFKKPSILILDEATNALDKETEIKLVNNLINKLKDTTIIMVTHKLDLVKNFNKTVKIEKAGLKIYNK